MTMATFYVIFDPIGRAFVRKGSGYTFTHSLNFAKHFTSEWSANNFRANMQDADGLILKKIVRQ